jgi:hypothetical protein
VSGAGPIALAGAKDRGVLNLFWKPADAAGGDERLATSDAVQVAESWSPDSRVPAYEEGGRATGSDIWTAMRPEARILYSFTSTA